MFSRLLTSNTVLFVCDVQGAFSKAIYGFDELVDTTGFLLKCFRSLQIPCVITEQYPEKLQHTVDDLDPLIGSSEMHQAFPVFAKVDYTMYTDEVKQYMKANLPDIENIVICGLETHICVLQTCMDLMKAGYNVHVCVDAVSSRSPVDRKVALYRMQQSGVQLTTSESVAFQLIGSKNHPTFKTISSLVKAKKLPGLLDF